MPASARGRRVLLFPWGAGGGAAYTGHCLVLADRLAAAGYQVAFSDGGASDLVRRAGYEVLAQELPVEAAPDNVPLYLPFANVERMYAVAARLYRRPTVRRVYAEDARIIDAFRPDLVVVDMAASAAIAAQARGLPVVSIAELDFVSRAKNSWMPWFDGDPLRLLPHPPCLGVWNELRAEVGVPPVEHFADQFWGDLTVVPSVRELDPVDSLEGARGRVVYAGPMYWDPPWIRDADVRLPAADAGRRRVYVTLGSGGMCTDATVQAVLDGCADPAWEVFVSLGLGGRPGVKVPANATAGGFTGLTRPLRWADVVVTHGGSSTVIGALAHDKPMVVVPVMSECEMNGRRYVEAVGAGQVVRYSEVDPATGRLLFRSRYSPELGDGTLRAEDVRRSVGEVLGGPAYAAGAAAMGARLREAARAQESLADLVGGLL